MEREGDRGGRKMANESRRVMAGGKGEWEKGTRGDGGSAGREKRGEKKMTVDGVRGDRLGETGKGARKGMR